VTPRILIVEDDPALRSVLERSIRDFGYETRACGSAEEGLEVAREDRVDLGLFDLRLPGMSGQELLEAVLEERPGLPVVFLSGHGTLPDAVRAMRAGAYDFLVKPVPLDELELTLQRALEFGRLRRQNSQLRSLIARDVASEIVGESAAVRELRSSIARVAASDANVLISGENGTGKELVARAIHDASPRCDAPFVVVNCGAIPTELFESELFGHRRGAFTGADHKRTGLIALAAGGTLFLDEIGELPLRLQPALLRVVQFGEYRPVGAEGVQHADVRVLAATNRDLARAISRNEFREDLYHRISTLTITVPALREREGDVQLLARVFLERMGSDGPSPKRFTPEALERLATHAWTGNVRELENVVVRLLTLTDGPTIGADDVDRHVVRVAGGASPALETLDLQTLERAAVVEALRRHAGHRERAAAELGIAVKTLYNKIRQHGIAKQEWTGAGEPDPRRS